MELWIRSQDEEILVKVNNLSLVHDIDTWEIINSYADHQYWELGTYTTKERALEVLDEIQRLITDLQYMSYAVDSSSFYSYRPNVYEMPEE